MSIHQPFEINASTYTLKFNDQVNGKVILDQETKFEIPIFQRPYCWTVDQIKKFVNDLLLSFCSTDGVLVNEPMFIGTMQLSAKRDSKHEVIDGQQRLTTMLILLKVLKEKFPGEAQLENISLSWLASKVNNGLQEQFLQDFINSSLREMVVTLNPYLLNGYFIKELIDEAFSEEGNFPSDYIKDFVGHLLSKVYFVVIETRAGLSKTLQIFNAINTTGLDLSGDDIFKIRMYEYLTTKQGFGERTFEGISALYENIDRANERRNRQVTTIHEILSIYQSILIARHNLPLALQEYNANTFFERLFDTLFNIEQWEHYKNNLANLRLSLSDLQRIIDIRFDWNDNHAEIAEDICAINIIWWSRYGRHWKIILIFMFQYKDLSNCRELMFLLTRQLSKLYAIYSIRFAKGIYELHRFNYELVKMMMELPAECIISKVNQKIGDEKHENYRELNWRLDGDLTYNGKVKNIFLRMAAMLSEDYHVSDKETISRIYKKIFAEAIDIEHIQAYHDLDEAMRPLIIKEWGEDLGSLGNLVVLEPHINRSIKNQPYAEKIKSYVNSEHRVIHELLKQHPEWNLDRCQQRKEEVAGKIMHYLFDPVNKI